MAEVTCNKWHYSWCKLMSNIIRHVKKYTVKWGFDRQNMFLI